MTAVFQRGLKPTGNMNYNPFMPMSFRAITEAISSELKDAAWIVDVFEGSVVYAETNGDHGTTGKLFKRSYKLTENGVSVQDFAEREEVVENTSYAPIKNSFTLSGEAKRTEGEFVFRTGPIFKAGDYPDKGFTATEEDLEYMATTFTQPIPLDLEHIETVLTHEADGVERDSNPLGELVKVWKDGPVLFGTVKIARWLDELFGKNPIACSVTIGRVTHALEALALTNTPRVEDAQLAAAFTASVARSKKIMPDSTPEKKKSALVKFGQAIAAMFSSSNVPTELEGLTEEDAKNAFTDDAPAHTPVTPDPAASPDTVTPDPAIVAMTSRVQELEFKMLNQQAETFAAKLVLNGNILPTQKPQAMAMYAQAVKDDNAGAVQFNHDGGARTKTVVDFFNTLKAVGSMSADQVAFVLPNQGQAPDKMTKERKAELIAKGSIKPKSEATA